MDNYQLENWLDGIHVRNAVNADVEVTNNSPLEMLGKGRQGAVFRVTDEICVKVFGNEEDCEREHFALSLGQQTNLFPRVHAKGPLYIAMDLILGIDLREYLQSQPLSRELSYKLIQMLITFKSIGFERIDHHKRQIFIQPDGNLKVIDVARTVWRDRVYPFPRKLLTSLGEENKAIFLSHVQEMAPELYEEWLHYIRMEELSHQIMQVLLPQEPDKATINNLSKQLLTTADEEKYVAALQGLVHKVFKEEWVKTMLARGINPDEVMEKIDDYWDAREMEQLSNSDRNENHGQRFAGESLRGGHSEKHRGRESEKPHHRKKFVGESNQERNSNRNSNRKSNSNRNTNYSNAPGVKRRPK